MVRGFLSGAVFGAVVSGVGMTAGSYLGGTVELGEPPRTGTVELPAGTEFDRPPPETDPVVPAPETPPSATGTPEVAMPVPDAPMAAPDTLPADTPVLTAQPDAELAAPEVPEAPVAGPAPAGEQAVPAMPEVTLVPGAGPEAPPSVTAPNSPAEAPGIATPVAEDSAPELPQQTPPSVPAPLPAAPERAASDPSPSAPDPAPEAVAVPTPQPEPPVAEAAPESAPEPVVELVPEVAEIEPPQPAPPPAPEPTQGAAAEPAPEAPPSVLSEEPSGLRLPVPEIEDLAPGILTDRLPRIGEGADPAAEAETDPEAAAPPESVGPALLAHATPFEVVEGQPLMSIVLIDPGPGRADPAALAGFPVPLTIGLDPMQPGATEAMAAYRAAGHEVAVLTPLVEGAAPADVEQAFQVFLDRIPQAVSVLDLPEAVLQENRPRAAQVAEILAETGHGMITYERGLNSGLQVADSAGVPAIAVFRDFDDGTRDIEGMKRVLDAGAFRAAQQGGVIMTGALRPDTIAALAEWVLGSRASTVTLAPASAVLRSLQ